MHGQNFLRLASDAFVPFLRELGFSMDTPSISGRFYSVDFTGPRHAVSVSYEPGDDALFVVVFSREDGRLSDYDDRSQTPRLSDLNQRYMHLVSERERAANQAFFESVVALDSTERLVLKSAKELRLVLPRYLRSRSPNRFPWLGFMPLLCGLFVICYLAVTEESVSTWIFPTGIVAFLMIGSGCRLMFRQRGSGWPGR